MKWAWLLSAALAALAPRPHAATPALQPFLQRHCLECHDTETRKGGFDLTSLSTEPTEAATLKRWVRVFDRVAAGEMPPEKKVRPGTNELGTFLADLGSDLRARHATQKGTVLRRLNRREYQNTLNDLLGVQIEVASRLPEDGRALGFDTIGDALNVSGIQLLRAMEAAEYALKVALVVPERPETRKQRYSFDVERNRPHLGQYWRKLPDGSIVVFTSNAAPSTQVPDFAAPTFGNYRVRITGYGFQINRPALFSLISGTFHRGGDQEIRGFFELPPNTPDHIERILSLRAGDGLRIRPLGLSGPDGHSPIKDGADRYPGEGLAIQSVEVEGPLIEEWPPRGRRMLLRDAKLRELPPAQPWLKQRRDYQPRYAADLADPRDAGRRALAEFIPQAFRRPVTDAEVAPYLALFEKEWAAHPDYLEAITTAAVAVLCSPEFLYLREPAGELDGFSLAARLSYFLTRSAPDAELLGLASERKLTQPATLQTQTERLLTGPALDRFVTDFTDGWLNLRDIEFTTPDKQLYPEFDELLLDSMLRETRGFIRELLTSNLSLTNLIQSDFAMLNGRLAQHYGLAGVTGVAVRKVALPPHSRRGGLLTQASVLKVSANGTTTSPVVRGAWVLERLLGVTPQPPPPGIPGVEPDIRGASTIREILAKHRSMESCNSCHRTIDPPGFALESYDVIGGWRDRFRTMGQGVPVRLRIDSRLTRYKLGALVDASGQLPTGETFRNFPEFQNLLLASRDAVARCVIEKLLVFGTGREMGFSDRPEIDRLLAESRARNHTFRDLVHAVVQSTVFRHK